MYEASNLLIAVLRAIQRKLLIVTLNRTQEVSGEYDCPFYNTGGSFSDPSVTFAVQAYCWDKEKEQTWNFKWYDVEISWYKDLGRGTVVNKEMTLFEINEMLEGCLESLDKYDEETQVCG